MDDRRTQTLDELKLRGDAAMMDTRRMINDMRTMARQTRRITEQDRPWAGFRIDPIAECAK